MKDSLQELIKSDPKQWNTDTTLDKEVLKNNKLIPVTADGKDLLKFQ